MTRDHNNVDNSVGSVGGGGNIAIATALPHHRLCIVL